MLSEHPKRSRLTPEVTTGQSEKQVNLLRSQNKKRQPEQAASGETPSKKVRQDLSEETSQIPLLFSAKKLSNAKSKLTEPKGLSTFIEKQTQFFKYLKDIIGNGPTYEVAQTAKLLAQHAYTNSTTRSGKITYGYGRALTLYNKVMDRHDANAAYQLATLYLHGNGNLPQDSQQNLAWLTVSAILGNAQAQFDLAQFYETTANSLKSTQSEYEKYLMMALQWYEAAAEQSYPAAIEPYQKLSLEVVEIMEKGEQEAAAIAESTGARRCTRTKK